MGSQRSARAEGASFSRHFDLSWNDENCSIHKMGVKVKEYAKAKAKAASNVRN